MVSDENDIREEAIKYFQNILASNSGLGNGNDVWQPNTILNNDQINSLLAEIINEKNHLCNLEW